MKHLFAHIARHSGLRIADGSRERLEQHIRERMRALDLPRPQDFVQCLQPGAPGRRQELHLLAAVLTTGETFFMRDAGQMQLLRETLLPQLLEDRAGQRRLRLWSTACSTGEEAYSLAILLHELLAGCDGWQIQLYGTDVNPEALRRATAGEYGQWAFRGCAEDFRRRYFEPAGDHWVLQARIRGMVRFMPGDLLLDSLPAPGRGLAEIDLILCRNLFIYFQPEAIARVTHTLARCLRDGGILLTGHGELRTQRCDLLQPQMYPQSVVYRKGSPRTQSAPGAAPRPLSPVAAPGGLPSPSRAARPPARPAAPLPPTPAPPTSEPSADPLLAAWRLADAGCLHEALTQCRRLLAQDPMRPEPHFLAAVVAMELGDTSAARAALRKALYLAPDLIAAHVHLERLQAGADQPQAARRTRAIVARLLEDLPPDARVPFLGESRAAELGAHWARLHGVATATTPPPP